MRRERGTGGCIAPSLMDPEFTLVLLLLLLPLLLLLLVSLLRLLVPPLLPPRRRRRKREIMREEWRRRRRRRTRENPRCISDAAIYPPVPCPLLIGPYRYLFHTWTRALERQAPRGPDIGEKLGALRNSINMADFF